MISHGAASYRLHVQEKQENTFRWKMQGNMFAICTQVPLYFSGQNFFSGLSNYHTILLFEPVAKEPVLWFSGHVRLIPVCSVIITIQNTEASYIQPRDIILSI